MSVLAAIVFLFVGAVLGAAVCYRVMSRDIDRIVEARDRWVRDLSAACRKAEDDLSRAESRLEASEAEKSEMLRNLYARIDAGAEKVALIEGQRNRLARLLRKYDRCECGMERREHGPEGFALAYGRCSGFRLKTPADSLETVVETDPPMGLSELYDPSPGEESSQKIAPKLAEKMAARQQMFLMQRGIVPVEQLEKALVENSYEPATIITSPVLTPEQITKLERADKLEVIDLRENRDEPPADCEVVPVPNPKSEEYSWYSPPIRRTAEDLNEPMCVSDEGLR